MSAPHPPDDRLADLAAELGRLGRRLDELGAELLTLRAQTSPGPSDSTSTSGGDGPQGPYRRIRSPDPRHSPVRARSRHTRCRVRRYSRRHPLPASRAARTPGRRAARSRASRPFGPSPGPPWGPGPYAPPPAPATRRSLRAWLATLSPVPRLGRRDRAVRLSDPRGRAAARHARLLRGPVARRSLALAPSRLWRDRGCRAARSRGHRRRGSPARRTGPRPAGRGNGSGAAPDVAGPGRDRGGVAGPVRHGRRGGCGTPRPSGGRGDVARGAARRAGHRRVGEPARPRSAAARAADRAARRLAGSRPDLRRRRRRVGRGHSCLRHRGAAVRRRGIAEPRRRGAPGGVGRGRRCALRGHCRRPGGSRRPPFCSGRRRCWWRSRRTCARAGR
jgi:hypothetical protein